MELIPNALGAGDERDLLLDGAHNEDGAAALAAGLVDLAPHLRNATGAQGTPPVLLLELLLELPPVPPAPVVTVTCPALEYTYSDVLLS